MAVPEQRREGLYRLKNKLLTVTYELLRLRHSTQHADGGRRRYAVYGTREKKGAHGAGTRGPGTGAAQREQGESTSGSGCTRGADARVCTRGRDDARRGAWTRGWKKTYETETRQERELTAAGKIP